MVKRLMPFVVLIGVVAAVTAQADDGKKDLVALQGSWSLVSGVRDGTKISKTDVKSARLTIMGSRFSFGKNSKTGTSLAGTITLDPSKTPKEINAIATSGPDKGKTSEGIYEITGDQYKMCFAQSGKERPKEFAAPPGSGYLLHTWRRSQIAAAPDLKGDWTGEYKAISLKATTRSNMIIRITEQDGETFRGVRDWKNLEYREKKGGNIGDKAVTSQPFVGVVHHDGKHLTIVEQGDRARIDAFLPTSNKMRGVYADGGDNPVVFRFELTRTPKEE